MKQYGKSRQTAPAKKEEWIEMSKKASANAVAVWQNQIVMLLPNTFNQQIIQENMSNTSLEEKQWVDEIEKSVITVRTNEIEDIQNLSDDMFFNLYFHYLKRVTKSFVYRDGFRRMYQGRELFAIQYNGEVNGIKNSYLTVFYKEGKLNYDMTFGCAQENWKKNKKIFVNILDAMDWV